MLYAVGPELHAMRYEMIAVDLDGTLLNDRHLVDPENLAAVARAQAAGAIVVPCTGRSWRESRAALELIPGLALGVFATGAAISNTETGASLDIAVLEANLAMELVRFMQDLPEAVLVLREHNLYGHDYLVTGRGTLTANTQHWFAAAAASVHFQRDLTLDDLRHTLRVGVVAKGKRIEPLTRRLRETFGDRVLVQSFEAIQLPKSGESVHILEVFASGVDKWRGVQWIASQRGIELDRIAAIGDEVNDLALLESAGCGIAMANAAEPVKRVADHITLDCRNHGVAHAIDQLLAGAWG